MRSDDEAYKQTASGLANSMPPESDLDVLKTKLRWAQESQHLAVRILELLNRQIQASDAIREILDMVKEFTGFEAVGIRLRDGEDFPYFETKGFPGYFVEAENSLCGRTEDGDIIKDCAGNPVLECMCGNIICGRTDPSLPFFTQGGSFWSNCTTELLATTTDEERQTRTRNRCNGEGYESVALVPLRSDSEIIGLLQLNDSRKNCFTSEMINFFEGVGVSIGIVLERTRVQQNRDRLFDLSIDMLCVAGFDGFFKQVNPAFTNTLGWTKEELLSMPGIELVQPEDREVTVASGGRLASGEPLYEFRNRCRHRDGSYRWVSWNMFPIPGEGLIFAVGRDVTRQMESEEALRNAREDLEKRVEERTAALKEANEKLLLEILERKRAEEAIQQREARYSHLINAIPDGVVSYDTQGNVTYINDCFAQLYGWSQEEVQGRSIDFVPPAEKERTLAAWRKTFEGKQVLFETKRTHKSGEVLEVQLRTAILRDREGAITETIVIHRDITERKRAEEAIQKSEEHYRSLFENMLEGYAYCKMFFEGGKPQDFIYLNVNDSFERLTGLRNVVGRKVTEVIPGIKESNPEVFEIYGRVALTGNPEKFETYVEPLGIWFSASVYSSEREHFVAVFDNITDRKRAEDSLRNLSNFQQILIDAIPNPVFYKDINRKYIGCNEAFAAVLGLPKQEVVGRSVYEVVSSEVADIWNEKDQAVYDHPHVQSYDFNFVTADGTERFFINRKAPFFAVDGSLAGLVGVMVDITDRKRAELALRESEERVRTKLNSILLPEGDIGPLELADVIDTQTVQALMDDFFSLTGIPVGIIDLDGRILVATGWQDICTKFHRMHPETCGHCIESDTMLSRGVEQGSFKLYRCQNNMWDVATPIIVGGKHLGNIFLGQFLFEDEVPDYDAFRSQAHKYGFDEQRYLAALEGVPRWNRETVDSAMTFYIKLADILSTLGYSNIKLARSTSEQERLVNSLRESEERYRVLVEEGFDGLFLQKGTKLVFTNSRLREMLGYNEGELEGQDHWVVYHPDYREITRDRAQARLRGEPVVSRYEVKLQRKDGSSFDCELLAKHIQLGGKAGIQAWFRDITERKRAEDALRQSEEKYRASFNNAAVGIDLVDRDGRFLEVNETLSNFLGYTPEELQNLTILDVTHPEDVAKSADQYHAFLRGETKGYRLEKRYRRKDGEIVWADTSVSAILGRDGEYRATVGVIADITKRRKSEETARRLATAVEQAAEAIVITDTEGTILYVNPAFESTTGYSHEEALGNNPSILKSGHHAPGFYRTMWETLNSGRTWSGRLINKKKDGTLFEEEATISPISDDSGKTVSYVGVKRDVSKEVSLQRQLHEAQKMEAIGTLAGGIAHDFNNLLQVTLGYSELLLTETVQDDAAREDLHKIHQAALSGADLVQRLLTFSRKVEPRPVPMSLNKRIKDVEKLLSRTIPKMIDIRLELGDDTQRINADPALMEQVLMNLAVNARDAMPDGGALTIRTRNVALDEGYCELHPEAMPGDYVLLSVSDTGQGMAEATIERIFEPFYTTKELGRGTGLGLAMVYGIVKQHCGHITCQSELGAGTTFKIYLPAIPAEAESDASIDEHVLRGGTETILLVDDEEVIRELGKRILERSGYTVLTAANGKQALNLYAKQKGKISLVILDLIMPEMGGKQCLEELLKIDPELKVVIASGYSPEEPAQETIKTGAGGFIAKPYNLKEMLWTVREILDRS